MIKQECQKKVSKIKTNILFSVSYSQQKMEATEEQQTLLLTDSPTFLCWIRKISMTSWSITPSLRKCWPGRDGEAEGHGHATSTASSRADWIDKCSSYSKGWFILCAGNWWRPKAKLLLSKMKEKKRRDWQCLDKNHPLRKCYVPLEALGKEDYWRNSRCVWWSDEWNNGANTQM